MHISVEISRIDQLYVHPPLHINTIWFGFFGHIFKDASAELYTFLMGSVD